MNKQGKREQEGNLGQPGKDAGNPAGTSGRSGNTGPQQGQPAGPIPNRRPNRNSDDEESGLGNRTTFR